MSLEPPRVIIRSTPMPAPDVGKQAYEIIGATPDDVQREITRIQDYIDIRGGEAHFRNPMPDGTNWRSTGYTRLADAVLA